MIEFDEATHTYKLDGKVVPNVTGIISETVGVGWKVNEWFLTRGKAIHLCAAFIAQGKEFKFDERLSGYVSALRKFFKEVNPTILGSEIKVASDLYQYAGTLDLLCKIGYNCIIDYKHSIDKYRLPLQLGGYSQAWKETSEDDETINYGYGVEIKENGTYSMSERIDLRIPRNEFLALRTAYRIKERCGELSSQKNGGK
jgi:hypothetical protein